MQDFFTEASANGEFSEVLSDFVQSVDLSCTPSQIADIPLRKACLEEA